MKTKIFNWTGLGLFCLLIFACEDVFESNLSERQLTLLAPSDQQLTEQTLHTFWWEEVEGAAEYNLHIVEGTFAAANALVLDTTITQNMYEHTLSSGDYQWRVNAQNSAYETAYAVHTLFVDTGLNISSSQMALISPSDHHASSDLSIDFNWEELSYADFYRWQLRDVSGNLLSEQEALTNTTTSFDFVEDGYYTWKVQGLNTTTNTSTTFTSRSLYVDTQAPEPASLTSPANGDTLPAFEPLVFLWTAQQPDTTESEVIDYLYVSADSSFSQTPASIEDGTQTHTETLTEGSYYWKVERVDLAGNTTAATELNQFVVQGE